MRLGRTQVVQTIKRLSEAIGYLELGMTKQATACLDGLKDAGPFHAIAEMLRGEVARRENRLADAARSFEAAARMLPGPNGREFWMVLSTLHRQAGNAALAVETLARARGARPPRQASGD